jgi:hypothetical protein
MIEKVSFVPAGKTNSSIIFNTGRELIKTASDLRPDVEDYAKTIHGDNNSLWVLVHAIGAFQAYGANNNGDATKTEALNYVPKEWNNDPSVDKILGRHWSYGWPTYYGANVFANHVNKDPSRAVGSVEYVTWNPDMLRVELVLRLDRRRAEEFGGEWAIKRMDDGRMVDVSMGMRVPFDLASTTIDWEKYQRAVDTFDPKIHGTHGRAVLAYHKNDPIPGLSITRNDYPDEVKLHMNKILPDGSKIFVWNTFPRFFDISLVFRGAEKPAKIMHKFASQCKLTGVKCASCKGKACGKKHVTPSAYIPELMGVDMSKTAGYKTALEKKVGRLVKKSEIDKETPATFDRASVAQMADREEDLPKEVLDRLGSHPLEESLSTPSMMGMKLKPHEFQRIILIQIKKKDMADRLDEEGKVFPKTEEGAAQPAISHDSFSPLLGKILAPFMSMRSGLSPHMRSRVTIVIKKKPAPPREEENSELLKKVSALYNAYENKLASCFKKEASLAIHQQLILRDELFRDGLVKEGSSLIDKFTMEYLKPRG